MAFPQIAEALNCFLQIVTLRSIEVTTVDFVPTETVTDTIIDAVIQPESGDRIQKENIDWDLDHILIHTTVQVELKNQIQWNGVWFEIIQVKRYKDYGYYEAVGEEIK